MTDQQHYRKLERMYLGAPVNEYFSPSMQIGEGTAEVSIKVRPDFFHAANAVHGYLYFKVLDDSTFFAVSSLVKEVFVLTVSFNLHFTRPVSEGVMKATAEVVHRSKRLFIAEGVVVDSRGREVGRGTGTFMPSDIKLTPELGYG
ncbi:MAG: PaaI family thioesterase [Anaerolineales bacterium]